MKCNVLILAVTVLILCFAAAFASQPVSGHLRLSRYLVAGGGAVCSAGSFQMNSVACLSTPTGFSSDSQQYLHAGYLEPVFRLSHLSAIQDLVMERLTGSGNMRLSWTPIPTADHYAIFRNSNSDFVPSPATQIGTTSSNIYTEVNALALPSRTYYYVVTGVRQANP